MSNGWKRKLTVASLAAATLVAVFSLHGMATRWWSEELGLRAHLIETESAGGLVDQFKAVRDGIPSLTAEIKGLRLDLKEERAERQADQKVLYRLLGLDDAEQRQWAREQVRETIRQKEAP